MAKFHGIGSASISGKSGGNVFAKGLDGGTIMRAYQPKVKNPKTMRQQAARNRFSIASGIAAVFAKALEIGYAQAVSGMRMYTRNLAVRDMIASTTFLVQQGVDEFALDATEFAVSKRAGIFVKPNCSYTAPVGTTSGSLACSNYSDVEVNAAVEKLGVVYVIGRMFESGDCELLAIKQSEANMPVTVTAAEATNWADSYVWAFFKKIPISGTYIPTTDTPWKYPSDTSETAYTAHIS